MTKTHKRTSWPTCSFVPSKICPTFSRRPSPLAPPPFSVCSFARSLAVCVVIKIYDLRLKSYRTALEEFQPSWDGSVRRSRGQATAAEYVARDLDELNARYQWLLDVLYRRLQQLYALVQQDRPDYEVNPDSFVSLFRSCFSWPPSSYPFLSHIPENTSS